MGFAILLFHQQKCCMGVCSQWSQLPGVYNGPKYINDSQHIGMQHGRGNGIYVMQSKACHKSTGAAGSSTYVDEAVVQGMTLALPAEVVRKGHDPQKAHKRVQLAHTVLQWSATHCPAVLGLQLKDRLCSA
jgi:hypothetical protein